MTTEQPSLGASRRKNGRDASCEPCRKSKIRCDHARPICSRCRQRGLHSQCYYHPAPLSRKRASIVPSAVDTAIISTIPEEFSVPEEVPVFETPSHSVEGPQVKDFDGILSRTREEHLTRLTEVLQHLRDFDRIRDLMTSYWPVSQSAILPEALLMSGISSLGYTVATLFRGANEEEELRRFAAMILDATSKRVRVTAALGWRDFMGLFTNENLRLEYLGFVFSITARSYLIGMAKDGAQERTFTNKMYQCSTTCLELARQLTPVNDMTIWQAQDHAILAAAIEGDSSESHWRYLGELHLDIFALGIYCESFITSDTPFFLAECRRRTFARAYRNDKYMSILLDRPCRLLNCRTNTQMPLDLSDDELLSDNDELALARAKLSPEGWSPSGCHASTWARIRFITATMTEQIFEYKWLAVTEGLGVELRTLAEKNRATWMSLPAHLRYDPRCWQSGMDPQNCFLLLAVYLSFLNTEFLIFQMIAKDDADAFLRLVSVSAEIVALALELGSYRRKAVYMHARFSDVLLYHGLAPALVLCQALTRKSRSEIPNLPHSIRRSALIRHLSSFVSQLESISGPGEANYDISSHAAEMITTTLDEVLESAEAAPSSTSSNTFSTPVDLDMANLAPDVWTGFDLNDWQKNFDWNIGYDCF